VCAFVFFAFFGFTEARKYYCSVILSIPKRIEIAVAHHSCVQIGFSLGGCDAVANLKGPPCRRDSFDPLATIRTFLVGACPSYQSMRSSGVDSKNPLIARVLPLRILRSQRVSLRPVFHHLWIPHWDRLMQPKTIHLI